MENLKRLKFRKEKKTKIILFSRQHERKRNKRTFKMAQSRIKNYSEKNYGRTFIFYYLEKGLNEFYF